MGKYLKLLIVALVLSICSCFPRQLGLLFGEMGMDTGALNFVYVEGVDTIVNIIFQLEHNLGETLMVYREPEGWDCVHHGDRIELLNGSLDPNGHIQLIMSCKWYMYEGIYMFSTNVTTIKEQSYLGEGEIVFPKTRFGMMALQILFHLSNPIVRVFVYGATLIILVLEIRSRQSTSAPPASDPSQD